MLMNYKKLTAAIIALTISTFTGSSVMAHSGGSGGHGGGFHGGGFGGGGSRGGFNSGGFRGGFNSGGFRGGFSGNAFRGRGFADRGFRGGFRGDRFRHRGFDDFVFFGDFGDPFFYYPYPYYGYYPDSYYPYGYGYESYNQPVSQGNAGYSGSLVQRVQMRLAQAGYYHAGIDGVSGNATRTAIREYERAHSLPADGQIRGRLLTTMGLG